MSFPFFEGGHRDILPGANSPVWRPSFTTLKKPRCSQWYGQSRFMTWEKRLKPCTVNMLLHDLQEALRVPQYDQNRPDRLKWAGTQNTVFRDYSIRKVLPICCACFLVHSIMSYSVMSYNLILSFTPYSAGPHFVASVQNVRCSPELNNSVESI